MSARVGLSGFPEADRAVVREAVARAAQAAGIADVDDIDHPAFAEAYAAVSVEDGSPIGAAAVVAKMREIKPDKFAGGWDEIDDGAFARREANLRADVQAVTRPQREPAEGVVNAANLGPDAFDALDERLRRSMGGGGHFTDPHRASGRGLA